MNYCIYDQTWSITILPVIYEHHFYHCITFVSHCVVPFCMAGGNCQFTSNITHNPSLADVAPTVLNIMGIDVPSEMTGKSLLKI
jgi:bisphosphoglycerate-independent phosphoglycerate mutase (AlkP superfamily)